MAEIRKSKRKYGELNLVQQKKVLDELDKGVGSRTLGKKYNVTKSTINNIRNRRNQILQMHQSNVSQYRKRKFNEKHYFQLNSKVIEFFNACRSKNIPISGPILQASALKIATDLGLPDFRASNGWLDSFRKSHQIVFKNISGESADVNIDVIDNWFKLLTGLCSGYSPENIFNADETALFYKQIPSKTLHYKTEQAKGGKLRKERLTVLLCASSVGEKLPLLVIGHAAYPRAFKQNNVLVDKLPVEWTYNHKAWMTSSIFTNWVNKLNKKMVKQKRSILLFVDNAPSHSIVSLSNIRLMFFPPNTSACIQPMDQGVIKTLKTNYRQYLMKKLIASAEDYQNAYDFSKSINVFHAIMWLSASWDEINERTIQRCFENSGFIDKRNQSSDEIDLEDNSENFISNFDSVNEFYSFDSNLDVHGDFPDTIEGILETILHAPDQIEVSENEEEDETVQPTIPSFSDAISSLDTVIRYFANNDKNILHSLFSIKCKLEKAAYEKVKKRQTLITDFMK